jgi:hypothetical protein
MSPCRDASKYPFSYPLIFEAKDGSMLWFISHSDFIRDVTTGVPTHLINWFYDFRPFIIPVEAVRDDT